MTVEHSKSVDTYLHRIPLKQSEQTNSERTDKLTNKPVSRRLHALGLGQPNAASVLCRCWLTGKSQIGRCTEALKVKHAPPPRFGESSEGSSKALFHVKSSRHATVFA
eukprot:529565-Amphidinium_carterae.1